MFCEKVTVAVPTYNSNVISLKRCIESIINQSYENIEIIIIDDCSTNNDSIIFINELEHIYYGVKVLRNQTNMGISASRNKAICMALGKWIYFVDHDDYLEKNRIDSLVMAIDCNTKMVMGGYMVREDGVICSKYPISEDICKNHFLFGTSAPWNKLISVDFLKSNGLFFPKGCYIEDTVFNINCFLQLDFNESVICLNYGHYNCVNKFSTSRSDKFTKMESSNIPLFQMREIYYSIKNHNFRCDNNVTTIAIGSIIDFLSMTCCLFTRKTGRNEKQFVIQQTYDFLCEIDQYCNIEKCLYEFRNNTCERRIQALISTGFIFAFRFGFLRAYCILISYLLNMYFGN